MILRTFFSSSHLFQPTSLQLRDGNSHLLVLTFLARFHTPISFVLVVLADVNQQLALELTDAHALPATQLRNQCGSVGHSMRSAGNIMR